MKHDRRDFLRASVALGAFFLPARVFADETRATLAYLNGTMIAAQDDPALSAKFPPGYLKGQTQALAANLLKVLSEEAGPGAVLIHGGGLCRGKDDAEKDVARRLLLQSPLEPRLTEDAGGEVYSYTHGGVRMIHLAENAPDKLAAELDAGQDKPTVVVCAIEISGDLTSLLARCSQIALVLVPAKRAGASVVDDLFLVLEVPPAAIFPCAGMVIDLSAGPAGTMIAARLVQSSRLDLVEKSYQEARPADLSGNLGPRKARSFVASPKEGKLAATALPWDLSIAPRGAGKDTANLAVMTDTHVCLDKFIPGGRAEEYELIGHFTEQGSIELYRDILDQIASGRHRVEFYDETFARDPKADKNFHDFSSDFLLLAGDLTDRGMKDEAEILRGELLKLPAPLKDNVLLTLGNHDVYANDFITKGPASSERGLAEFYEGLGPAKGSATYAVELTDWLTLVVLNTTIPTQSGLGFRQDRIDMLDDLLSSLANKAVVLASHQPIHPISTVPPAMTAYLRMSSHFTPTHAAAQDQLQALAAKHGCVKLLVSGHYHGAVADQFKKVKPAGPLPDDRCTTHLQVPCTVEYPCGYHLIRAAREGGRGVIEWKSAYSRLHELRTQSLQAPIFKLLGSRVHDPEKYGAAAERLMARDNVFGAMLRLDRYDLADLNVRGFKDGTARAGKGNTGKDNRNGRIEFTIG